MKYILIIGLATFFGCSTIKTSQNQNSPIPWIDFLWVETTVSGTLYEKAGIKIPLLINNSKEQVSMQFDIGSQQSFLNGKSIAHLQTNDSRLLDVDTVWYDKSNFDLVLNNVNIRSINKLNLMKSVFYKPGEGELYDEEIKNGESFIVGTIGANILQHKILIIDYPNNRLAILDNLPEDIKVAFVETTKTYGKINIPIEINGTIKALLYDTGASIFEIATTPEGYKILNDNSPATTSIQVPSFGTMLEFKGAESNAIVKIGNRKIEKPFVYYSENENVINFFQESEIFGLTGNALFLDETIIIDYQNNRFGIVE